jgi:16S rRNA (cytosine967-C5)-methyltransferase
VTERPLSPGAFALAEAARVVEAVVFGGESADAALEASAGGSSGGAAARPAVQAVALGTLRWYLRLQPAVEALLERPTGVPAPVRALLAAGAHQVEYSHHAPEASVHAAVDAARGLGAPRATGLVNAVLRRFAAERGTLLSRVDMALPGRTAHPAWLVERICAAWPARGPSVLEANNAHPPMVLRIDRSRMRAQAYLQELKSAGIGAQAIQWADMAVVLDRPVAVGQLPGFAEGVVSVQDAGAQLAASLLQVRPGLRVLDACAAPGGKTGQLLELLGEGADLTAVDRDPERLARVRENLRRLRRTAALLVADLRDPPAFWDGRPFDRILLDAPCSATGVIRRHPDIKLLRRPGDIAAFAATQRALLGAALTMLAPGGRLVYSTCSVLPEENEQVIASCLAESDRDARKGLKPAPLSGALAPGALERSIGVQLLPGADAGTDGFYYACLEKTTAGA